MRKDVEKNFDLLYAQKEEIENEFGNKLEWAQKSGSKPRRILHVREADLSDDSKWPEYIRWMRTNLEKVDDVFRERIKTLGDKK